MSENFSMIISRISDCSDLLRLDYTFFYWYHSLAHTLKLPATLQHHQVSPLLHGLDGRHDHGLGDLLELSYYFRLVSKDGGWRRGVYVLFKRNPPLLQRPSLLWRENKNRVQQDPRVHGHVCHQVHEEEGKLDGVGGWKGV